MHLEIHALEGDTRKYFCTSNTASKASKASNAMHLEIHALEGDTRTHRLSEHRHALNSLASVFVLLYW
jgi:hypothetical protein